MTSTDRDISKLPPQEATLSSGPSLINASSRNSTMGLLSPRAFRDGVAELVEGLSSWRIWHVLGITEIKRRHSRSRLGQLWLTISTAISMAVLSFVWAVLWKMPLGDLLPYICLGLIFWQYLSSLVSESVDVFSSRGHLLLNQRLTLSILVFAMIYRNLAILGYNAVIAIAVLIWFRIAPSWHWILIVPGLFLTAVTAVWIGFVWGVICTRFRDVGSMTASLLQLAFYVTPVIWKPSFLSGDYQWLLYVNPFSIFLGILRDALLEHRADPTSWLAATIIAFGGLLLSLPFIGTYRRRILVWL